MSKGTRITDRERTATMLDLVRRRYEGEGTEPAMSRAYVVVEEVAPGTGFFGTSRYADVLALGVWPSNGLTLDGIEIKASRADLKREVADLTKHHAVARYCDSWTLVAWERARYADTHTPTLAIQLGRSLSATYGRAQQFGLSKSEAYLASPAACRLRRGEHPGKATQFKKGHVPANKGCASSRLGPGRMKQTPVQEGHSVAAVRTGCGSRSARNASAKTDTSSGR
jgi:hypothetical protein